MFYKISNRFWNQLIKLVLVAFLAWAIYRQVFAKENVEELWQSFQSHFVWQNMHWLLLNLFLIPVNWGLEALKWQQLIRSFSNYRFWRIFKAILAGVAVGLFTPNRVGEYGGRVLMVEAKHNWKAVIATLVGSFSQLLVLISFGLIGLIYFGTSILKADVYVLYILFFFGLCLIGLMLFGFYNVDVFVPIIKRFPYIQKFKKQLRHLKVLQSYSSKELSLALFFSTLRYLTYSTQYYFMLRFFGIDVSPFIGFVGISTIYLLQSSVPLPPVVDLFARGEVAIFIWRHLWTDSSLGDINILASTYTLFIINLIFPALIGAVFVLQVNVLRSLGLQK